MDILMGLQKIWAIVKHEILLGTEYPDDQGCDGCPDAATQRVLVAEELREPYGETGKMSPLVVKNCRIGQQHLQKTDSL